MQITKPTPFFQSERNFRRFEPTIATILKNYPDETIIVAHELSSETIAHRLRDAIRNVFVHGYKPNLFDLAELEDKRKDLKICRESNRVVARFITKDPLTKKMVKPIAKSAVDSAYIFNSPAEDIARAAVYIAANALGNVKLIRPTISQLGIVTAMAKTYDIAIVEEGSDIIVL